MRARSLVRAVTVVGLAFAGLVGGHALGYAIAIPDVHHRSTLIADTGHGYLPSASWTAVVLGLAALVAGVWTGYVGRTTQRGSRFGPAAFTLMGAQALAFILVELVERLVAGASLVTLSPVLVMVGIAVQLVAGLVGAMLIVGLRKVGAALRAARRHAPVVIARSRPLPSGQDRAVGSFAALANNVRAPPAALAA